MVEERIGIKMSFWVLHFSHCFDILWIKQSSIIKNRGIFTERRECPHSYCCPPGWRGAAAGCCEAAAERTPCGDGGRVRPAGCALAALLLSPCSLSGPGWMMRHLCVDTPTLSAKHTNLQTCLFLHRHGNLCCTDMVRVTDSH